MTRTTLRHRMAAFVATLALALNLAVAPFVQAQAALFDAFGQPICSEHASGASGGQPGAPADAVQCQFCCTLAVAAPSDAPVLPMPRPIEWKRISPILVALQLPSPSAHLFAPPRGPPSA